MRNAEGISGSGNQPASTGTSNLFMDGTGPCCERVEVGNWIVLCVWAAATQGASCLLKTGAAKAWRFAGTQAESVPCSLPVCPHKQLF